MIETWESVCPCGVTMNLYRSDYMPQPPRLVVCVCQRRFVWAVDRYHLNPPCKREGCAAEAFGYRNGYDEPVFFCDTHEAERWAPA